MRSPQIKSGFEAYQMFNAIHLHFNSKTYEYWKYNGRTKVNRSSFENNNAKYFFEKLAKHRDPFLLTIVAHFNKPSLWVGNIFDERINASYIARQSVLRALEYNFKCDMLKYDSLNDAFTIAAGDSVPKLYLDYRRGNIHPETLIICNKVLHLFTYWNTIITDIVIWPNDMFLLEKYGHFIDIDVYKYNDIMKHVDNQ